MPFVAADFTHRCPLDRLHDRAKCTPRRSFVLVRDGRILDILPSSTATLRYSATSGTAAKFAPSDAGHGQCASRGRHAAAARCKDQACAINRIVNPDFARDSTLAAIAEMLKSGITCFCDRSYFPEETLRTANEQGMRVW